jgi:hypothetical protein
VLQNLCQLGNLRLISGLILKPSSGKKRITLPKQAAVIAINNKILKGLKECGGLKYG